MAKSVKKWKIETDVMNSRHDFTVVFFWLLYECGLTTMDMDWLLYHFTYGYLWKWKKSGPWNRKKIFKITKLNYKLLSQGTCLVRQNYSTRDQRLHFTNYDTHTHIQIMIFFNVSAFFKINFVKFNFWFIYERYSVDFSIHFLLTSQ